METATDVTQHSVTVGTQKLPGNMTIPPGARGIVLFAHGSGSSRLSPRNTYVAQVLHGGGLATLLFDLLDEAEAEDRQKVFDIVLLAERLEQATDWVHERDQTRDMQVGYFGASTGAAAALVAAARRPQHTGAVVSRGGRPDLAEPFLAQVEAPTLLIVGGLDDPVVDMNRQALDLLRCKKTLEVVPGATHLFPEPGALEQVARSASEWFQRYLVREQAVPR